MLVVFGFDFVVFALLVRVPGVVTVVVGACSQSLWFDIDFQHGSVSRCLIRIYLEALCFGTEVDFALPYVFRNFC